MNAQSISLKKATTTSIKHNNRDFKENDWVNDYHKHIDRSRTHLNQNLVKEPIQEAYEKLFGKEVKAYNDKQKRKDRKIENYYSKVKDDKTLNSQYEIVVQVGENTDNQSVDDWKIKNEILKEYVETFEKRNPQFHVYNAVIHNDEASPHLHLNFIPVAEGYKQGMKKRPAFNKALLNMHPELKALNNREAFRRWRNQEINFVEDLMKDYQIERKEVGTNDFHDLHQFKSAMKEMDSELNSLKDEYHEKIKDLDEIEDDLEKIATKKIEYEGILYKLGRLEKTIFGKDMLEPAFKKELTDLIQNLSDRNIKLEEIALSQKAEIDYKLAKIEELDCKEQYLNRREKEIDLEGVTRGEYEMLQVGLDSYKRQNFQLSEENQALEKENSLLKANLERLGNLLVALVERLSPSRIKKNLQKAINQVQSDFPTLFSKQKGERMLDRDDEISR